MKIFYALQKQTDIFGWNTQSAAGHTREMQALAAAGPASRLSLQALELTAPRATTHSCHSACLNCVN